MILAATPAQAEEVPRLDPGGADIRIQLVPRRFTTLSSEIPARLDRLTVKEGERFKEGQVLIGLDCSLQRAQADEARAALAAAEKTKAVNRRLVELNSGGVLEADVAVAEAAKAQAKLQSAQVVLSKCAISAPFPGRVVEQKVREHQYVQAGQPLLDILDDTILEVEFIAPSSWLTRLKVGMPFQVQVEETGKAYPARIARTGAKVDAVSHSVKVVGEIVGGVLDLVAGMSGRILPP
ncbi:MAG: efflux RND transporter periplasmic adaptor subunit [Rhodospirillales bacterium]|nr:efflux RND transporter periplasmic adaptor subunit [Rhodospirillales bacterium]